MGELNRLTQIVIERLPRLALYARQWLDAASADDVVQEALVKLLMQPAPPDDPIAWMCRAVRNAAINSARSSSRRRRREQSAAESRREWFEARPESLIDAQLAEQTLRNLPDRQREIVVLRIWNGLGFAQIGQIVGLSTTTVHDQYAAALEHMRRALENPCRNKTD